MSLINVLNSRQHLNSAIERMYTKKARSDQITRAPQRSWTRQCTQSRLYDFAQIGRGANVISSDLKAGDQLEAILKSGKAIVTVDSVDTADRYLQAIVRICNERARSNSSL